MTTTAAIVLGGISAIGAVTSAIINSASTNHANHTNVDLARENMAYQTSEREAAQEYNSPVNQRKRFEAAGINPYLAMSQMDAGTTTAQSGVTMPQVSPVPVGDVLKGLLSEGSEGFQKGYELEQYQLGTEQMRVDARYKLTEKIQSLIKQRVDIESSRLDNKTKQANLEVIDKNLKLLENDLQFSSGTLKERMSIVKKQEKAQELDNRGKELLNEAQQFMNEFKNPAELQAIQAGIREAYSRVNLNGASAASQIANAALSYAQEKGVKIDNYQKNKINHLIRQGVKLDNQFKKWNVEHPTYVDKLFENTRSLNRGTGLYGRDVPSASPVPYSNTVRW